MLKQCLKLKHLDRGKNVMGSKPLSAAKSGITAGGAINTAISIRHAHFLTLIVIKFVRFPLSMRISYWQHAGSIISDKRSVKDVGHEEKAIVGSTR